MRKLGIGVRVRYIGQAQPFQNPILLILVGRTGIIRDRSTMAGCDWFVEMDEGCIDLDSAAECLIPISDSDADVGLIDSAPVKELALVES